MAELEINRAGPVLKTKAKVDSLPKAGSRGSWSILP
jgi:hypothetical protein